MPGALNFINYSISLSYKPYQIPNIFTATAVVDSATIFRPHCFAGRWRRTIIPFATTANPKTSLNLGGHKSDARQGRKAIQVFRSETNSDTTMRTAINGEVENQSSLQNHIGKPPAQPPKLLTLPTILTIGRVAAVPLLTWTFYVESWWGPSVTTGIFIAAAFTDWLDGYLARKMNLGTAFGAFLDPVADKLMVAATLILMCTRPFEVGIFGRAPWLMPVPAIVIIGREITMSAVREWAASQDRKLLEAVAVNSLGKLKTATQMIALTILLAARDDSLLEPATLAYSGVALLYISAWLALWSLIVYVRKISKVLLR